MLFALLLMLLGQAPQASALHPVFVCEHGAAKSLIATAYFNKLAAERGLAVRATFRGIDPQDALSTSAVAGLRADGLAIPAGTPTLLASGDVAQATQVFAIGCQLPENVKQSGKAVSWDDVPDNQGYAPMRDALVRHVTALIDTFH